MPKKEPEIIRDFAIDFWLPGHLVPKARPRVTRHGTYMPQNYQDWRADAELSLQIQMREFDGNFPLKKVAVIIWVAPQKGDPDNLGGSCLDALVSAGALHADTFTSVPNFIVLPLLFQDKKKAKDKGALIWLRPCEAIFPLICQSLGFKGLFEEENLNERTPMLPRRTYECI